MDKPRATITLTALALSTAALGWCPPDALAESNPEIVAIGDFETAKFDQWVAVYNPEGATIVTSPSPVRKGRYAAKFVVRDGDQYHQTSGERVEVSTPVDMRDVRAGEGDEYFYAWSTYIPQDFPKVVNWFPCFINWHSVDGGTQAPISVGINTDENMIRLQTAAGHGSADDKGLLDLVHFYPIITDLQRDTWVDYVLHVKWTIEDTGLIEVWYKYESDDTYTKAIDLHDLPTLQQSPFWYGGKVMPVYQKVGLYRSASEDTTQVIYHDSVVVGTTFGAVTERAHGDAVPSALTP